MSEDGKTNGEITEEGVLVEYTNIAPPPPPTIEIGSLSVTKTVTGSAGDKTQKFKFTFVFTDSEGAEITGSYPYKITRTASESGISP